MSLLNVIAALGGKTVSPLPNWADISGSSPVSTTDETLSGFSGSIDILFAYGGFATVEYRIDSGSWTTYSGTFSISNGQTLGWRFTGSAEGPISASATNDTISQFLDSFNVTIS